MLWWATNWWHLMSWTILYLGIIVITYWWESLPQIEFETKSLRQTLSKNLKKKCQMDQVLKFKWKHWHFENIVHFSSIQFWFVTKSLCAIQICWIVQVFLLVIHKWRSQFFFQIIYVGGSGSQFVLHVKLYFVITCYLSKMLLCKSHDVQAAVLC